MKLNEDKMCLLELPQIRHEILGLPSELLINTDQDESIYQAT